MYSCRLCGIEDIVVVAVKRGSFVCESWWGGGRERRGGRGVVGGRWEETRLRNLSREKGCDGSRGNARRAREKRSEQGCRVNEMTRRREGDDDDRQRAENTAAHPYHYSRDALYNAAIQYYAPYNATQCVCKTHYNYYNATWCRCRCPPPAERAYEYAIHIDLWDANLRGDGRVRHFSGY